MQGYEALQYVVLYYDIHESLCCAQNLAARLPFLDGLAIIAARLTAKAAADVTAQLTESAAQHDPQEDEASWIPYYNLLKVHSEHPVHRC